MRQIPTRTTGAPLTIRAVDWNAMARHINEANLPVGVSGPAGGSGLAPGVFWVKNATGGDLARFQPVALSSPIADPAQDAAAFFENRGFSANAIAGDDAQPGRFGVYIESVPDGEIGRAAVYGVHAIEIDGTSPGTFVRTAGSARLESIEQGFVPIIWREPGAGTRRALVQLATAPEALTIEAVITGSSLVAGVPNRWRYEWEQVTAAGQFPAVLAGGRNHTDDGYAFNTLESNNTASGVQGNGVNIDNLPGTMGLVPIGVGAWVQLRGPVYDATTDANVWLFQAVNAIDGDCE